MSWLWRALAILKIHMVVKLDSCILYSSSIAQAPELESLNICISIHSYAAVCWSVKGTLVDL